MAELFRLVNYDDLPRCLNISESVSEGFQRQKNQDGSKITQDTMLAELALEMIEYRYMSNSPTGVVKCPMLGILDITL